MKLSELSNAALLADLNVLIGTARQCVARIVAYLTEVETRRLDLEGGYSSMFDFCQRKLGISQGEAYRRLNAARLAQRFPSIVERLERGAIHLSALVELRDYLMVVEDDRVLDEVTGKSPQELKEWLAARAPRPDVPSMIEQLPNPGAGVSTSTPSLAFVAVTPAASGAAKRSRSIVEPLSPERYKVQLSARRRVYRHPACTGSAVVGFAEDLAHEVNEGPLVGGAR